MTKPPTTPPRGALRAGRILGVIVFAVLLADAAASLLAPHLLEKNMAEAGLAMGLLPVIGTLLLGALVLYAIPRTSVLGAILLTGFLGGAICTHLRLGEIGSPPQIVSALLGIGAWASLYLRRGAVRAVFAPTS